jgi:hypothetical protein
MREEFANESNVCKRLRALLASLPIQAMIEESEDLTMVLVSLGWLVAEVMLEVHPEWKYENLDDIYPELSQKIGENEIEIIGLCNLMSDQSLTPLHLGLQIDPKEDTVSWLECWLGEATAEGMLRVPYDANIIIASQLNVLKRLDFIEWVYHVQFGERRT